MSLKIKKKYNTFYYYYYIALVISYTNIVHNHTTKLSLYIYSYNVVPKNFINTCRLKPKQTVNSTQNINT